MSLSALAAFAAANNNATSNGRTPTYELSIEDARKAVKISDGNKTAKEDGTQALKLSLGKITLSLAIVAPKATRVNAPKEQVEAFTADLQAAIDDGSFDPAIVEAQAKAKAGSEAAAIKAAALANAPVTEGETASTEEQPALQVDLDSLD